MGFLERMGEKLASAPGFFLGGLFLGLALLAFICHRLVRGAGFVPFFVLAYGAIIGAMVRPGWLVVGLPMLGLLALVVGLRVQLRKGKYLPPIAEREGGEVRRGLTPPEAAILLEQPLNRVLGLVLLGMLKRGLLKQVGSDPLRLMVSGRLVVPKTIADEDERLEYRTSAAQKSGLIIRRHEHAFLARIQRASTSRATHIDFSRAVAILIQQASSKIEGFDLENTRDYYRRMIDRAFRETNTAVIGAHRTRDATIERQFEWLLLHDDHAEVLNPEYFSYRPDWLEFPSSVTFSEWLESLVDSLADLLAPRLYRETVAIIDMGGGIP